MVLQIARTENFGTVYTNPGRVMRELDEAETKAVSGGGIAYDLMHSVGDAVGGWYNEMQESLHNDPFRRQYQAV